MNLALKSAFLILALVFVTACERQQSSPSGVAQAADLLFLNGKVYTLDPDQPWATAVAVGDGRIVAVGSDREVLAHRGAETRVVDLGGRLLMPGLIDAHVHPAWGGVKDLFNCNFPFSATPDEIGAKISECVAAQPGAQWIMGGQWTSNFFVDNDLGSPREWLDQYSGDKAVVLTDDSGHNHWLNSRALELAGIDSTSPDPAGGKIVRNPQTGEPNGVLEEAYVLLGDNTPDPTLEQYTQGAAYAVAQANQYGVTGMKDASASAVEVEAFYTIDQAQGLTIHVATSLYAETKGESNEQLIQSLVALREKFASEHVHTNFVKIFLDGVPTASRSAAMLEPYLPLAESDEDNYGSLHLEPQVLADAVTRLDQLGFTVKIHTAGDRSVRVALDAIEQARKTNGRSGLRHELAHAGYIHASDIDRFAALNAVADFSPHLWFPSLIIDSLLGAVGERGKYYWPTRDLLDADAPLLVGSDWPSAVPDMNPWRGLEALVTRKDPGETYPGAFWEAQAVSLEEAVEIFTLGGAQALKLESVTGSVEVGKSADLIVLQENIFDIPASEIGDTRVVMTWFEGELVYSGETAARIE
jgi:predicted amidohydrolase YtcJ